MLAPEYYVGLMSGTSLDGVDAALVYFHPGQPAGELIHTAYLSYPQSVREQLLAMHFPGHDELHRAAVLGNALAELYSLTVTKLLTESSIGPDKLHAIGCHGQTVRHRPDAGYTIQLVNPSLLAERSRVAVVADFRNRDIAAGGQGAPLVPAFHAIAMRHPLLHRVIVNIGGIANLTDLPPEGEISGFDCGPGNLLMDAWCQQHTGQIYDRDGAWGAQGTVIQELLKQLIAHEFFSSPPPKSAGREQFNPDWLHRHLIGNEPPQDVQATLLQLTLHGIVTAIQTHCQDAAEIYICGGGVHNIALMQGLQAAFQQKLVAPTNTLGIDADWLEAHAFAWLARQTLLGLPGNLPQVTGADHPCILGAVYPA